MQCIICLETISSKPVYPRCTTCSVPMHLQCYNRVLKKMLCPICRLPAPIVKVDRDRRLKCLNLIGLFAASCALIVFPHYMVYLICVVLYISTMRLYFTI